MTQSKIFILSRNVDYTEFSAVSRKTLYQIVCTYLKKSPADEPVYQFLDKKRAEGKPYFVYMTAAQNKFLRIYYARVKECLEAFDTEPAKQS